MIRSDSANPGTRHCCWRKLRSLVTIHQAVLLRQAGVDVLNKPGAGGQVVETRGQLDLARQIRQDRRKRPEGFRQLATGVPAITQDGLPSVLVEVVTTLGQLVTLAGCQFGDVLAAYENAAAASGFETGQNWGGKLRSALLGASEVMIIQ